VERSRRPLTTGEMGGSTPTPFAPIMVKIMGRTKWQKEHPERVREINREWRKRNREHVLELKRKYRERHREELIKKQTEYYRRVGWYKRRVRLRRIKKELVEMLGGKCQKCGYDKYIGCLEFHHIDPNEKEGEKEWQKTSLRKQFIKKIQEGKIMLLCNRCHREIHLEELEKQVEERLKRTICSDR